ncbi:hypothetical protein B0H15DRAFT_653944 [Mycena belliarum]|uniref:Uncharacterized protein n=1 Tax=Mycena belliarum TaxID=1033014 RepID=A0AAD6TPE5_9AGAR|nr:hypothetical protein B0H15DRAFT_653944 [Mycena belliae]
MRKRRNPLVDVWHDACVGATSAVSSQTNSAQHMRSRNTQTSGAPPPTPRALSPGINEFVGVILALPPPHGAGSPTRGAPQPLPVAYPTALTSCASVQSSYPIKFCDAIASDPHPFKAQAAKLHFTCTLASAARGSSRRKVSQNQHRCAPLVPNAPLPVPPSLLAHSSGLRMRSHLECCTEDRCCAREEWRRRKTHAS